MVKRMKRKGIRLPGIWVGNRPGIKPTRRPTGRLPTIKRPLAPTKRRATGGRVRKGSSNIVKRNKTKGRMIISPRR